MIAPEGAEVRLVAMTAEAREPIASKRRILNEFKEKCANYSMKLTGNYQNMFRVGSGIAGYKGRHAYAKAINYSSNVSK